LPESKYFRIDWDSGLFGPDSTTTAVVVGDKDKKLRLTKRAHFTAFITKEELDDLEYLIKQTKKEFFGER
jgi:hypothetical protein